MDRANILMLGWEFPPVINGGLGVACHDLCIALTKYAHVTMIVPKSNPDFLIKNCELIGLNNVDIKKLMTNEHTDELKSFIDIHYIESASTGGNLDPYYFEGNGNGITTTTTQKHSIKMGDVRTHTRKTTASDFTDAELKAFQIDSLYGGDVIEKVHLFADVAVRVALTKKFDIIHCHDWMTLLAGMEIKRLTGKPLVVHIHSLEIDRGGADSRNWVYETERRGMEYADIIMPVSNFTGDIIKKYYGINPDKLYTIHNGIRGVKAYRTPRPFNEKMVLFVGRLTRQKGPEMVVEIASKVLAKNPDVRFVMSGTGEKFAPLIENSAFKHIGNRFHLTGFMNIKQVHQLLSMADAYLMPSVSEPFGLSAVEAVQFGVPCVISKQSGVAEVLQGSLRFDFWDTERAAGYILNLLQDDVLTKNVAANAYHDLKGISWDISAKKVVQGYREYGFAPFNYAET